MLPFDASNATIVFIIYRIKLSILLFININFLNTLLFGLIWFLYSSLCCFNLDSMMYFYIEFSWKNLEFAMTDRISEPHTPKHGGGDFEKHCPKSRANNYSDVRNSSPPPLCMGVHSSFVRHVLRYVPLPKPKFHIFLCQVTTCFIRQEESLGAWVEKYTFQYSLDKIRWMLAGRGGSPNKVNHQYYNY